MRVPDISAAVLHERLRDGLEIALLDVREAVDFAKRHINLARHLPLSTLELDIGRAVPRLATRIVLCDGGDESLNASSAAVRAYFVLRRLAYTEAMVLRGGVAGWIAQGFAVSDGHATMVRAFADQIRQRLSLPMLSAHQLHKRISVGAPTTIIDVRTREEYAYAALPSARNYPGVELPTRRLARTEPDHLWVINCFSRTRGVIGTATLRLLMGKENVAYLDDGVMSWFMHGYQTTQEAEPVDDLAPLADTELAQQANRIMAEWQLASITPSELEIWREDSTRSLYVFDVRGVTDDAPGDEMIRRIAGGQLLMHYETHVVVRNARIVLIDDAHGLRAAVTAFWLTQLGDAEVYVLKGQAFATAANPRQPPEDDGRRIGVEELRTMLAEGSCSVVDISPSAAFEKGHIPGAYFMVASSLTGLARLSGLPAPVVFVSTDGEAARVAARNAHAHKIERALWLHGGTQAWRQAGLALQREWSQAQLLTPFIDDWGSVMRMRPEQRKNAYPPFLAWERSLGARIEMDDTVNFKFLGTGQAGSVNSE